MYMKKEKWILLFVFSYLLMIIPGLSVPLIINAAKYLQVGREIVVNNDWINLTVGGDAYDQKPPLLFWIAAFIVRNFGISVAAYKIAVLLISLFGIYGTFKLAELHYGKRTGFLAAVFFAGSLGYIHFHNDIHTDTLLIVPVILSVWQYAAYFKFHQNYRFYLGSVFAGLGMLSKGPVAVVVIGSAVGLHLLLTGNYKAIFNIRWLPAALIVLILTLPALLGLYSQFGMKGISFFFWTNNAGRVSGSYAGNNTDPFFYLHTTLYMMAPWAVFCFIGLYMQIREKIRKKWKFNEQDEFYTLGGLLFYLLISSVAKAKNPHYEMVILPFWAIIGARWTLLIFENSQQRKLQKTLDRIHLFTASLLVLISFIFPAFIFPEGRIWIWAVDIALAGAVVYTFTLKSSMKRQLTALLLSVTLLLFTLNTNILPHMSRYESSFGACRVFNEQSGADEKLHIFTEEARYWQIFLYSRNYGRYIISSEDFRKISPPVNDWLYTGPEGLNRLKEMKVQVDTVRVFRHNSMSRLSLKFLNPKTRDASLKTRYLLQIKGKPF
jgi:4-amino-4-deoxy-L-arabinose transferase-like glycosyltransferase